MTARGDTPAEALSVRAMQIHDCYIVLETGDGMTVIDQHALHERILYEQFRQRVLSGAVESQRLLMPVPVELSAKDATALVEQSELLGKLGFGVEEFGKDTVILTRHPVMLRRHDLTQLVRDLAERLDAAGQGPSRRDLLDDLLNMMDCPHGRPTALKLSRAELDRQFGRLG